MIPADLHELGLEALSLALWLSLPLLGAALAAAALSAVFQSFTRLSEPTIGHISRIIAVLVAVIVAAPWLGSHVSDFAIHAWSLIQEAGR